MPLEYPIRLLQPEDIPDCLALSLAANWNQTTHDWLRLLSAAPSGCFGVEIDGTIQATTTVVCYGSRLAWIGMVLTAPAYRRLGLASGLLRHALDYIDRAGVDWIKLDATEMGRPVYLRFGFTDEGPVERWIRAGSPAAEFDEQSLVTGDSFARGRAGSAAAYFGPCFAGSVEEAERLVDWFLDLHPSEAIYWDLLPGNVDAVALAQSRGFVPVRHLTRMVRPGRAGAAPSPTDIARTYAIAGFEWG